MTRNQALVRAIADLREMADESVLALDVLGREAGRAQRRGDAALMQTLRLLADRHHRAFDRRVSAAYRLIDLLPAYEEETIGGVTVRRHYANGKMTHALIYNVTGWWETTVRTERGITAAAKRLNARDGV